MGVCPFEAIPVGLGIPDVAPMIVAAPVASPVGLGAAAAPSPRGMGVVEVVVGGDVRVGSCGKMGIRIVQICG